MLIKQKGLSEGGGPGGRGQGRIWVQGAPLSCWVTNILRHLRYWIFTSPHHYTLISDCARPQLGFPDTPSPLKCNNAQLKCGLSAQHFLQNPHNAPDLTCLVISLRLALQHEETCHRAK